MRVAHVRDSTGAQNFSWINFANDSKFAKYKRYIDGISYTASLHEPIQFLCRVYVCKVKVQLWNNIINIGHVIYYYFTVSGYISVDN